MLLVACSGSSAKEETPPNASPTAQSEQTPTPTRLPQAAPSPAPTAIVIDKLPIIDMHFHPDVGWDIGALVSLLDQLGVAKAVGGAGGAGSIALTFAGEQPQRFVPFAGQDAVRALYLAEGTAVTNFESDRAVRHLATLEEGLKAHCWAGIGELFLNTLSSHRTGSMRMPADSTLIRRLWEMSATYGVPLSVHMDADPVSVAEMRRLLALDRNGTWIWAHAGWYTEPALLRELLQAHVNLNLELSFRDELRSFFAVSGGGKLKEEWRLLLEEMPERFVLGTDLLPPPTPAKYTELIVFWRGILEQLTPATAAKLAYQNAERLLGDYAPIDATRCTAIASG